MERPLTIETFLERAVRVYPDRLAIVDEPDQPADAWSNLTWSEVRDKARAQAAGLDQLGLDVGDRVAIVSHNSARLLVSLLGIPASGRVCVPINFRLTRDEVSYIVEHCGAKVLIIDPELQDELGDIECEHTFVIGAESDKVLYPEGIEPKPWVSDEDATATINYTSGTTARPKGVEMTHRSLWLNATSFGWDMGVNTRDVYLHTLPMFHCNGWGMPFGLTGQGVPQIVLRKVDGAEILRRIEKHGVTLMCGAPAVGAMVLEAAKDWDGPIPGFGTTRIVCAGAPPPTSIIERIESELGWEFIQIYGLTETAPYICGNRCLPEWDHLDGAERAAKLVRAGVPPIAIDLKVDAQGEVLARGNHVLKSYWDQPDASAEALDGGWFHTGDGGYIDDEGYLVIADRKKDVIISGGENISSIEVEDVLFSHPAVEEVAVIGVPHEKWGESPKALVVLGAGTEASEQELIDFCRDNMAHFKCPSSIEFRDELARTATGKLQKFKLRAPYWEDMERQIN